MKRFQLFLMALLASCGMAMAQTAPTAEGGTIFLDNVPLPTRSPRQRPMASNCSWTATPPGAARAR